MEISHIRKSFFNGRMIHTVLYIPYLGILDLVCFMSKYSI